MSIATTSSKPNVHDQVFVEAVVGREPVRFRAVVVNVMPEALWLGLVKPDRRLEQVQPQDPVTLTFRRNGAGLVASERFLSHLGTTQSRLFSVHWNEDCQLVQRRENLRVAVDFPVEFVVLQSDVAEPGMTGMGRVGNMSAGGLQFRVDLPSHEFVVPDDLLELRLTLDNGMVLADATVIRVEDLTDIDPEGKPLPPSRCTGAPVAGIAVQFESISETAQDRIVRTIFSLQRMQKDLRVPGR